MDRIGHTTSGQVNKYRRAANTVSEVGVSWFESMLSIPERAAASMEADAAAGPPGGLGESDVTAEFLTQFGRRDSNPDKRNQNRVRSAPMVENHADSSHDVNPDDDGHAPMQPMQPHDAAASLDAALARALDAATAAGRFDVVARLLRELEGRRSR